MSKIRYYTDKHVAKVVVRGLRQRGVDVLTVPEANKLGADDEAQLIFALAEGRVFFTQDDDFLRLAAAGKAHVGIVYAPQQTPISKIIQGLMLIYQVLDAEEMVGNIEYFDRAVGWVAKPSVLRGGKVYCWVLFLNPAYLYWPRQTPDIEAKYMTNLYLELPSEISPEDAKVLLAIKLWETGRLSLGQAAVVAGYSKRAFMEILGKYGVPVFNYNPEDLVVEQEM